MYRVSGRLFLSSRALHIFSLSIFLKTLLPSLVLIATLSSLSRLLELPYLLIAYAVNVYRMSMSNQGIIKFLCRPEGIEALCEDLGVPPTDVRILLLAWYALLIIFI